MAVNLVSSRAHNCLPETIISLTPNEENGMTVLINVSDLFSSFHTEVAQVRDDSLRLLHPDSSGLLRLKAGTYHVICDDNYQNEQNMQMQSNLNERLDEIHNRIRRLELKIVDNKSPVKVGGSPSSTRTSAKDMVTYMLRHVLWKRYRTQISRWIYGWSGSPWNRIGQVMTKMIQQSIKIIRMILIMLFTKCWAIRKK